MIHTMKPEVQPTREEKIVLSLDQAHKNVSDALRDYYALVREKQFEIEPREHIGEQLRSVIKELETVANRFDNQTESENER